MATLHALTFGWSRAFEARSYAFGLPPSFMLELPLPCAVLLGRLGLALPCVARRLWRIRRGWDSAHRGWDSAYRGWDSTQRGRDSAHRGRLPTPREEPNGQALEDVSNV